MREFACSSDGRIGRILQLGVVVLKTDLSGFAFQTGKRNILVMHIQIRDFLVGPCTEAADSCNIFFDHGSLISSAYIGFKGAVPDQVLIIKHIEKLSSFSESFVHCGESHFTVDQP